MNLSGLFGHVTLPNQMNNDVSSSTILAPSLGVRQCARSRNKQSFDEKLS